MADVSVTDPTTGGTAQPAPHMEPIINLTEGEDDLGCQGGEADAARSADEQGAPIPIVQVAPEGLQVSPPRPDVAQVAKAEAT